MPAIVHTPRPSQTYTSVYDSATANDFNGTKTLAQIPITATDSVAIVGGKLQMGPTFNANGYAHNRATFAPSFKYGRIIAEFTVPPAGTNFGIFAGQEGGFDYFTYQINAVYANLFGASGPDSSRALASYGSAVPVGNLCRLTLDVLPDIDNTRQLILNTEDLTAITSVKTLVIADCTLPNLPGTFGVWNQSPNPQSAGVAFTRIAIFSADGAVDIPAATGVLVAPMGDSITQGSGTSTIIFDMNATSDKSYPSQLAQLLDGTYTDINRGHSGIQTTGLSDFFSTDVQNLKSANYTTQVAPILIGANDIGLTSDTAQVIYQRIVDLHTKARAAGFKTIAIPPYRAVYGSIANRSNADYITVVDAIGTQIAANWQTFADAYITLSDNAQFADPNTNNLLADKLHLNDAGAAYLANRVKTSLAALVTTTPANPPTTDPYRSDNATPVTILADYKPGAPNPFAGTGLGTFLLPTVVLTWINPANLLGGTIHILRMNAGTSDPFVVVGTVAGTDANTAPAQTYTDTTVLNGHRYTYTAFATPYGDTTTP